MKLSSNNKRFHNYNKLLNKKSEYFTQLEKRKRENSNRVEKIRTDQIIDEITGRNL
jgi:hypothetical protein